MTATNISPSTATVTPNMGAHALDYASKGWAIFPCSPVDKRPLTPRGFKDATTDADQIEAWWKQWPNAMIGSPMGSANGIFAIDPDVPDEPGEPNGLAHWSELQELHGDAPPTRTHVTPRGGRHVLFAWDRARPLSNREGRLKGTGINVRGEGGYVVLPPSCRADGASYRLEEPSLADTIAPAPVWLLDMIDPPKPVPTESASISARAQALVRPPIDAVRPIDTRRHAPYVSAAFEGEIRAVAETPSGGRNNQLNESAFKLGTLIAAGALDRGHAEAALIEAARVSGLTAEDGERAVMATIESGLGAGAKHPRQLPQPNTAYGDAAFGHSMVEAFVSTKQANENQEVDAAFLAHSAAALPYGRWHGERRDEQGNWLIKHLLSETGVALLAGQSGAGKTFLSIDLAGSLGAGANFFGRRVKRRCGTLFLVGRRGHDAGTHRCHGSGTLRHRPAERRRSCRFPSCVEAGCGPQ
jgi:hypothetical protein